MPNENDHQESKPQTDKEVKSKPHIDPETTKNNSNSNDKKYDTSDIGPGRSKFWTSAFPPILTATATVVIAIATICYVLIARQQWRVMHAQVGIMQRTVKLTERGQYLAYRPQMTVNGINHAFVNGRFSYTVFFKNVGNGPAINLHAGIDSTLGMQQRLEGTDQLLKKGAGGAITIGAGEIIRIPSDIDLSGGAVSFIKSRNSFIFVVGRADYEDVLGKSHWMKFCMRFELTPDEHFEPCEEGNETDPGPRL